MQVEVRKGHEPETKHGFELGDIIYAYGYHHMLIEEDCKFIWKVLEIPSMHCDGWQKTREQADTCGHDMLNTEGAKLFRASEYKIVLEKK